MNDLATATLRKISQRLIPFLFLLYVIAWLDRVNVGFAALQMNSDLKFSSAAFGLGSGIFFAGYCLFEVPSNIILERVGARLWIARIMVSWGLISAGMMFVRTPVTFCVLRFLLGVAEAGFFPGVVYYLSLVSGPTKSACHCRFHGSNSGYRSHWWSPFGRTTWSRWLLRIERMAMVVLSRRSSGRNSRYRSGLLPY